MKDICPYCKKEFDKEDIEKHKFECVSSYQEQSFNFDNKIPCEICHELIDFEQYNEHISLCSQPTGSIPILFSRFNTGSQDLLRLLNIPIPPHIVNNISNNLATNNITNLSGNENIDGEDNTENDNHIENEQVNQNEIIENEQVNENEIIENEGNDNLYLPSSNPNTMEYNINLINYNMNLINSLLRNSQFRQSNTTDTYASFSELDNNIVKEGLDLLKVSKDNILKENTKCPICLDEFEKGNIFKEIKCQHLFCEDCLEDWLEENKKCPVCMVELE